MRWAVLLLLCVAGPTCTEDQAMPDSPPESTRTAERASPPGAKSPGGPPAGPARQAEEGEVAKTVHLGRPVGESPDFLWRRSERDGQLMPSAQRMEPHGLRVRLPGGKVIDTRSRFTWVNQQDERVTTVSLVPDAEPASIGEALDQIEAKTKEWGAELSAVARERIDRTRRTSGENRRGAGSYMVGDASWSEAEERSTLFFTLRGGDTGWWVDVQIAAPIEGYPPGG